MSLLFVSAGWFPEHGDDSIAEPEHQTRLTALLLSYVSQAEQTTTAGSKGSKPPFQSLTKQQLNSNQFRLARSHRICRCISIPLTELQKAPCCDDPGQQPSTHRAPRSPPNRPKGYSIPYDVTLNV